MRARTINETIRFERSGDLKKVMGVGNRVEIVKFFERVGIRHDRYEIDDELNIFFEGDLHCNDDNL